MTFQGEQAVRIHKVAEKRERERESLQTHQDQITKARVRITSYIKKKLQYSHPSNFH